MKKPLLRALVPLILLLGLIVAAPAASAAPAAPKATGKYCFTEVDRPTPGKADTRVVARVCANEAEPGTNLPKGMKPKESGAKATMAAGTQAVTASGAVTTMSYPWDWDLLVTFFQHRDYGGAWDTIGGRDGTCDSVGHRFADLSKAQLINVLGISSYHLNGRCYRADLYPWPNFVGTRVYKAGQNVPLLPNGLNDQLRSMKVRS